MNFNKIILLGITVKGFVVMGFLEAQVSQEWVERFDTIKGSTELANSMTIDDSENVYVTGRSFVVSSITDGDLSNYATIKYNKSGVKQWVAVYNGSDNNSDVAKSVSVDGNGNVYVTGYSFTINTGFDYLTVKYNAAGNEVWVKRYNGPYGYQDYATSLKVDKNENVFVTGYSKGIESDYDYLTIKYNSSGEEQWTRRYNGTGNYFDKATSMALDDSGNVFVTGYSTGTESVDYLTIKYNSSGIEQWVARYNSENNDLARATSIFVDKVGNSYITGDCIYDTTFSDYLTLKYNNSGILQWIAVYDAGQMENDFAYSVVVDNFLNVYVIGSSISTETGYDYATIMYDTNGIEKWINRYNGIGNSYDVAHAIALDSFGNVYVTGGSIGIGTSYYEFATLRYSNKGIITWEERYDIPNSNEEAIAIAIGKTGNVFVSGNGGTDYLTIKYSQTVGIDPFYFGNVSYYELLQNFPNPFNPSTIIKFKLWTEDIVSLKIYDINGREIKTLVNDKLSSGDHSFTFHSENLSSGIYFYKLETENFSQTKKMLLIK